LDYGIADIRLYNPIVVGVSDGVVFISALKTTISSIQNCNFSEDYLPGFC
jgi:hypothetical protein